MRRITIADIAHTEAVKNARAFGVDLSLIDENLRLSPEQRLRKLQEAVESIQQLRKAAQAHR